MIRNHRCLALPVVGVDDALGLAAVGAEEMLDRVRVRPVRPNQAYAAARPPAATRLRLLGWSLVTVSTLTAAIVLLTAKRVTIGGNYSPPAVKFTFHRIWKPRNRSPIREDRGAVGVDRLALFLPLGVLSVSCFE